MQLSQDVFSKLFKRSVVALSGTKDGQQSGLGKQTVTNTKRPQTSRLIPWRFRC